jgi:hypothetical protein
MKIFIIIFTLFALFKFQETNPEEEKYKPDLSTVPPFIEEKAYYYNNREFIRFSNGIANIGNGNLQIKSNVYLLYFI